MNACPSVSRAAILILWPDGARVVPTRVILHHANGLSMVSQRAEGAAVDQAIVAPGSLVPCNQVVPRGTAVMEDRAEG